MKILYSWLKDFTALPDIDRTAELLAAAGIEVEGMEKTGACFSGVIVAEIIKVDRHPNADRLSLVEVETGSGRKTVVCGAKNIAQGQKVPLALVGAKLPGGELKKSKIRGIESEGMLCAPDELGAKNGGHEGILILDSALPPGCDAARLFGEPDCVFDVKILPNRPDLLSHYGIARELAACQDFALKKPAAELPQPSLAAPEVSVAAPDLCGRYAGRVIKGARAAQSPEWIRKRLEAIGVKPRNILVDATNYVLHELGYPLHAFDLNKLPGPVNVRRANCAANPAIPACEIKTGSASALTEKFSALDGSELSLDGDALVIAAGEKAVALAGIIGGAETMVSDGTTDIFLEAAWFAPAGIHRTARRLNMHTDSSKRFEGGTDPEAAAFASDRAVSLIIQCCGGAISAMRDVYPGKTAAPDVEFTPAQINAILGSGLPAGRMEKLLRRLQPELYTGAVWRFPALSWRRDIANRWDIAEEVARLGGFDCIPDQPRAAMVCVSAPPAAQVLSDKWRDILCNLGFFETYSYDFISGKELAAFGFAAARCAGIANPISEEMKYLRPDLLCGLAKNLAYNENRGVRCAAFFEIAKTYDGDLREELTCAGIMSGSWPSEIYWGGVKKLDFYHIRGVAEKLAGCCCGIRFEPDAAPPAFLHPKLAMKIICGAKPAGYLGQLHPQAAKEMDLKSAENWVFSVSAEAAAKCRPGAEGLKPVSQFPSSWRDMSVLVAAGAAAGDIAKTAKSAGAGFIADAKLTDVYEGKGMPEGKKSLTLRLTFTRMDRTPSDAEVDAAFAAALEALKGKFSAELRS
ncbi:MAG: phenylalanine--tRNA ligase subunit beta [Elusimicrobiales bacterium]